METLFKWIFAILIIILLYSVLMKNLENYSEKESNYFMKNIELYSRTEFCSSSAAKEHYRTVEECCKDKISCPDNNRGKWDSKSKACICVSK
jgi:hypothetical protein